MPFSVPYLLPFSPMKEWTSIATDEWAKEISVFCMRKSLFIFEEIDEMNGRQLTLGEICGLEQAHVSVPISLNSKVFPEPDIFVTDYLNTVLREGLHECG